MTPIAVFLSLLALSLAHPQHARTFEGRQSHLHGRIFGGDETTIQKYPYMVSLRDESDELYESHMCGGSIISENFVVTAGHCCSNTNTTNLAVRVGNTDVDQGEKHELSKITRHPDFYEVDTIPYNDICLLKVSKAFVYSDSIKAVKLTEANSEVSAGTLAVTTGWGATSRSCTSENVDGK